MSRTVVVDNGVVRVEVVVDGRRESVVMVMMQSVATMVRDGFRFRAILWF